MWARWRYDLDIHFYDNSANLANPDNRIFILMITVTQVLSKKTRAMQVQNNNPDNPDNPDNPYVRWRREVWCGGSES